jgi:hypothetical protein
MQLWPSRVYPTHPMKILMLLIQLIRLDCDEREKQVFFTLTLKSGENSSRSLGIPGDSLDLYRMDYSSIVLLSACNGKTYFPGTESHLTRNQFGYICSGARNYPNI